MTPEEVIAAGMLGATFTWKKAGVTDLILLRPRHHKADRDVFVQKHPYGQVFRVRYSDMRQFVLSKPLETQ